MDQTLDAPCPDEALLETLTLAGQNDAAALARIAELLAVHGSDARLHFLRGSLLAGQRDYAEARTAISRAVEIAPDYAIARFQLGLLELSSGDAAAADATLEPLAGQASGDALVLFARGLRHLARDNFDEAEALLRQGIACNREHPLVSGDMEMILAGIAESRAQAAPPPDESLSAAHMLLQQDAAKSNKH